MSRLRTPALIFASVVGAVTTIGLTTRGLGDARSAGLLPSDPHGVLLTVCAAMAVLQWVVSILILLEIVRGLGELKRAVTTAQAGRDQSPLTDGRSQK